MNTFEERIKYRNQRNDFGKGMYKNLVNAFERGRKYRIPVNAFGTGIKYKNLVNVRSNNK